MDDDYRVAPRTNSEIRDFAKRLRTFFGVAHDTLVDVLACAKQPTIWTVAGEKPLQFEILPDHELGSADGSTTYRDGVITIGVKRSVHYDAYMGVGRARNTVGHEFGHATLGHATMYAGLQMARRTLKNATPKWIPPFESAEHQVRVFAPAFLINDQVAHALQTAEDVSVAFAISLESAKIYFKELTELRDRGNSGKRVLKIAQEVRETLLPTPPKVRYMNEPCTVCGNQTLIPIGSKFLCHTCENVSDRFQDGDSAERA